MRTKSAYCDICKVEVKVNHDLRAHRYQVIFVTEQSEGRSCDPYTANAELDLCDACKARVLKGEAIFARGAQGYNDYYFLQATK